MLSQLRLIQVSWKMIKNVTLLLPQQTVTLYFVGPLYATNGVSRVVYMSNGHDRGKVPSVSVNDGEELSDIVEEDEDEELQVMFVAPRTNSCRSQKKNKNLNTMYFNR